MNISFNIKHAHFIQRGRGDFLDPTRDIKNIAIPTIIPLFKDKIKASHKIDDENITPSKYNLIKSIVIDKIITIIKQDKPIKKALMYII